MQKRSARSSTPKPRERHRYKLVPKLFPRNFRKHYITLLRDWFANRNMNPRPSLGLIAVLPTERTSVGGFAVFKESNQRATVRAWENLSTGGANTLPQGEDSNGDTRDWPTTVTAFTLE